LIVCASRYFGQTPDYWEDGLTLRLHRAQEKELSTRPPPEMFLAAYFEAQGWWKHSSRERDPVLPQSTLPEFEP
jgi:hypothetical protein